MSWLSRGQCPQETLPAGGGDCQPMGMAQCHVAQYCLTSYRVVPRHVVSYDVVQCHKMRRSCQRHHQCGASSTDACAVQPATGTFHHNIDTCFFAPCQWLRSLCMRTAPGE